MSVCVPLAAEPARVEPFAPFVRGLEAAKAGAYLGRPGIAVRSAAAFDEMRRYLLQLYRGVTVGRSFALAGQVFDCVPFDEQPGMRRQGAHQIAPPPPASDIDSPAAAGAQGSQCGDREIPMRRVTLAEITGFATLRDFLRKSAPQGSPP